MDVKHNEFQVQLKRDEKGKVIYHNNIPVIEKKEPTKRGHVRISEREAAWYNRRTTEKSGIFYEKAKEEPKLSDLKKDELVKLIQDKEYDIDINQNKADLIKAIEQNQKPE